MKILLEKIRLEEAGPSPAPNEFDGVERNGHYTDAQTQASANVEQKDDSDLSDVTLSDDKVDLKDVRDVESRYNKAPWAPTVSNKREIRLKRSPINWESRRPLGGRSGESGYEKDLENTKMGILKAYLNKLTGNSEFVKNMFNQLDPNFIDKWVKNMKWDELNDKNTFVNLMKNKDLSDIANDKRKFLKMYNAYARGNINPNSKYATKKNLYELDQDEVSSILNAENELINMGKKNYDHIFLVNNNGQTEFNSFDKVIKPTLVDKAHINIEGITHEATVDEILGILKNKNNELSKEDLSKLLSVLADKTADNSLKIKIRDFINKNGISNTQEKK